MSFTSRLLKWYSENKRDLPWRESADPYKIWLSEIILQQTRIVQGLGYYHRFLDKYPDIQALANASEDDVLSVWQGLGYYSRARNLHHTAKEIVKQYNGKFPEDYKDLLKLKGIGPYTAAAIASIAFNLPHATVDGNVTRVLARYFGITDPVNETHIKNQINSAANELMDLQRPGMFNQAMMDLGATICKPGKPLCNFCPVNKDCIARISGIEESIPVKTSKIVQRERFFHFFLLHTQANHERMFLIEKREQNDIWKNLHQLPLIETPDNDLAENLLIQHPVLSLLIRDNIPVTPGGYVRHFEHILTHQRLQAFFYNIHLPSEYYPNFDGTYKWVTFDEFSKLGKPVLISKYMEVFRDFFENQ
ncbi:MAG: A/G-specific adenine glycosylase [Bacteroidales bacterium]|nr:A/G-specific adenine glycosylase [Bacteroidales bacterium]